MISVVYYVFFFNDTATTEIYTLSLHDALPISQMASSLTVQPISVAPATSAAVMAEMPSRCTSSAPTGVWNASDARIAADRKSTRLNSSHANISYAVFCLKKKNINLVAICVQTP